MELRLIVGDTETTGPTTHDKVCEIAWVEIDRNFEVIYQVRSLIDPQMPISAGASGVHGIEDKDVAEAPTIEQFFGEVMPGALDGSVCLIAHNVIFDRRYFEPFIPSLAAEVCTLRLARRAFPEVENHKLPTLMYALSLDRGDSHSALGDVITCLSLLRKISEKLEKGIDELAVESLKPIWVEKMPFGKHRGMPVRALDSGYTSWLLKLPDLDRDTRWTLEEIKAGR